MSVYHTRQREEDDHTILQNSVRAKTRARCTTKKKKCPSEFRVECISSFHDGEVTLLRREDWFPLTDAATSMITSDEASCPFDDAPFRRGSAPLEFEGDGETMLSPPATTGSAYTERLHIGHNSDRSLSHGSMQF